MRILVYGAGPLGSLFAARLVEAGHDVVVLARGQRLADLRLHGIVLQDDVTEVLETVPVKVTDRLDPDDSYDLILVVMRKNQALPILPILEANRRTNTVLFMMNNAGGFDELVDALGAERVMVGFPLPGGARNEHIIRVIPPIAGRPWELPIGEVDGRVTDRTRRVAAILESMRDYTVSIRTDMDAWLKYHAALITGPALALYAAGTDPERLTQTPDALILGARALKEAFGGLRAAGIPPSPAAIRVFEWLPEPVLAPLFGQIMSLERLQISLVGHARAARDEVRFMADELRAVLRAAGAESPSLDRLYPYADPGTPPLPVGSREVPMDWSSVWVPGVILTGVVALVAGLLYVRRRQGGPG